MGQGDQGGEHAAGLRTLMPHLKVLSGNEPRAALHELCRQFEAKPGGRACLRANPDVVKRAQVGESARERIPKGGASDCADEINAADLRGRSDTRAAAGCAPSGLPSQQKTSIDHPRWMKLVRARRFSRRAPVQHIRRPISRVLYGLRRAAGVTAIPLARRLPGASSNLPE